MNKLIALLLLLSCISADAQQPILDPRKAGQKSLPSLDPNKVGIVVTDITLFEKPDYQGASGYFKIINGKLVAPFPLTDCSFRIPHGKIVYLKSQFEFASETVYTTSQYKITLGDVTGIRSDDIIGVYISLDGISTSIHNNDCKKVYGNIKIQIQELAPAADSTISLMKRGAVPRSGRRIVLAGNERWTFIPWDYASAASVPDIQYTRYSQFILNNNPAPINVTHPEWRDIVNSDPTAAYFLCGKKALREGRIKILFTSDIASAHKTCDLCDDFSSRIKMQRPVNEFIRLNNYYPASGATDTTMKKIVLGPYHASGSRDGSAITATAGTTKEFRAYYSMRLYE